MQRPHAPDSEHASPRRRALAAGLVIAATISPVGAHATVWWFPSAIGYGGVGAAIVTVVAATSSSPAPESFAGPAIAMLAVTGAGIATGAVIGSKADRNLGRGEPLGDAHRWAVRTGTVLAGGTVGLIAGAIKISTDDDPHEAPGGGGRSDEEVIATAVGLGLLGGALLQVLVDDHLSPDRAVSLAAAPLPGGGVGPSLWVHW